MTRRRRREFLGTLAVAFLAGCAFPRGLSGSRTGRVARVGLLALDHVPSARVEAFRGGLRDRGWMEGQNLIIDERYGGGDATRLGDSIAELIGLRAEVLVGPGGPTTRIARDVTSTTPIVMVTGATPVEEGLVASLARPGGNVTGLTIGGPRLSAKRLELLVDTVPRLSRLLLVSNGGNAGSLVWQHEVEVAAAQTGVAVEILDVRSADDLEHVLDGVSTVHGAGLMVLPDVVPVTLRTHIVDWAIRRSVPATFVAREWVDAGGLISYGPSKIALYRRAADYVDRIVRGARAGDLPIEEPATFELLVHLRTADALGIRLPQHILLQATEVLR